MSGEVATVEAGTDGGRSGGLRSLVKAGLVAGVCAGLLVAMREVGQVVGRDSLAEPLPTVRLSAMLTVILLVGGLVIGVAARLVMAGLWRIMPRAWSSAGAVAPAARLGLGAVAAAVLIAGVWSGPSAAASWWGIAVLALLLLSAYPGLGRSESLAPDRLLPGIVGWLAAALVFFAAADLPMQSPSAGGVGLGLIVPLLVASAAGYGVFRLGMLLASGDATGGRVFAGATVVLALVLGGLTVWQMVHDRTLLAHRIAESGIAQSGSEAAGPNVILISVDTLRHDYVGYADGPVRTPTMDAIAEESFVFISAYSVAPWTRPSFASFFSGLYPAEVGVARLPGTDEHMVELIPIRWATEPEMLTEIFQREGWRTAASVCNVNLTAEANADQGFDFFYHAEEERMNRIAGRISALAPGLFEQPDYQRADAITSSSLEVLEAAGEPLYFWAHYLDPHFPYTPPTMDASEHVDEDGTAVAAAMTLRTPGEREKALRAYVGEIEYTDEQLAPVIDLLRSKGLWDSSIVVFWGDHGEEFWEHEGWGHGHSLYEELLHVPLLIHMPGQTESVVIDERVTLLDVMPTLLDLCGLEGPEVRGRSLAPLLRGADGRIEEYPFFAEGCSRGGTRKALLAGDYKLIYDVYQDRFTLFDLADDMEETVNLAPTDGAPDLMGEWQEGLRTWTEASLGMMSNRAGNKASEIPPEIRQGLKDMGYIQ